MTVTFPIENRYLEHGGSKINVPRRVVVHCMAEYILDPGPIHAPEFLDDYGLSAHALVAPDGQIIICRHDDQIAWHARGYNTDSLGIEFLVEGEYDYASFIERIQTPYLTKMQYQAGVEVVKTWLTSYSIEKIDRHSDLSPGRKVDPGRGFPWIKFLEDAGWGS